MRPRPPILAISLKAGRYRSRASTSPTTRELTLSTINEGRETEATVLPAKRNPTRALAEVDDRTMCPEDIHPDHQGIW